VESRKTIGRYEIRDCVGRGGMGALFRGHDPVLDREVAIKTMLVDFAQDEDGRARFYREARAVARLQHRNIVTLFDFGEDEGSPYIVMEFLIGQTVAETLRAGTQLSIERVADIGAQLCTGLHFAHLRGVVHRDIKPPNIWLNDDGNVKVLDFGIAKFGDTTVTRIGGVVGSVSYMSPEQVSGHEDVDGRSDIFSVGIVLYELISGKRPFRADSPTGIMMKIVNDPPPPLNVPGVPPQLVNVIFRALEKDRTKRYQQANEMAADLRAMTFASGSWRVRPHDAPSPSPSSVARLATTRPAAGATPSAAANAHAAASVATPPPDTLGPEQETGFGTHALRQPPRPPDDETDTDADSISRRWQLGTAEDLVAEAVITPAHALDAVHQADAKRRSEQARRSGEWLARWPTLALAASVLLVGVVSYSLFVRGSSPEPVQHTASQGSESPSTPQKPPPTPGNTQAKQGNPETTSAKGPETVPTAPPTPGDRATAPTAGNPIGSTGGSTAGSTAPTIPVENSQDVHVILSGPYAFSVLDEAGRQLSGLYTKHDLRVPPKQVLVLQASAVYLKQRVTVDGKAGGTVQLRAPGVGYLNVRTNPETCPVILDDAELGFPPIAQRRVAAGRHRVTLNCEGTRETRIVTIVPDKQETVTISIP
jgi:serine/threonine protein kinase